jgi:hypothetical protein
MRYDLWIRQDTLSLDFIGRKDFVTCYGSKTGKPNLFNTHVRVNHYLVYAFTHPLFHRSMSPEVSRRHS